jgi:hypothetical protein
MKQLFALANKYEGIDNNFQWDIEHASYSSADIIAITSKINAISKAEYEKKYNDKTKISFFAGIAVDGTTMKPFGHYQQAGGKISSSYFPSISFGTNFFASPHTGKLVFRAELILSGSKYNSVYIYTGSPYVPVRYSYNQLWFAVVPQIVYNFYNTDSFKIHVGLGIALTFYKYYNANYDLNYEATQVSKAPLNPSFFNNSNFPIVLKTGVKFKDFDLFAGYFTNTTVSNDVYFRLNTYTTQIGIDYFFH